VSMRSYSDLVYCYEELYHHHCIELRSILVFFRFPLLYSESIILALTLKLSVLQESILSDIIKCDSCNL
jgi:hypothetical protein